MNEFARFRAVTQVNQRCGPGHRVMPHGGSTHRRQGWFALAVVGALVAVAPAAGQAAAVPGTASNGPRYTATITRTAYGIPHITAGSFGSLGFGYGFALASDDLCTMATGYLTVRGQRSRYLGPDGLVQLGTGRMITNLSSDIFWRSVIGNGTIARLLSVRTGPAAIGPQLRRLIAGYVAGYNHYLASVGGSKGVSDPTCRGKPWVQPITTQDAYLLIYQLIDLQGQTADADDIADARPPAGAASHPAAHEAAGRPAALSALASAVVGTRPGTQGLPSVRQLRALGQRMSAAAGGIGSNAIAVGSAGTRDHRHGLLLGNPHFPWRGIDRFYQVQLTIPGMLNVEGATIFGIPLVVIGFTATMAWSQTRSPAFTVTPYQLALVPGHPTEYIYNGRPVPMISRRVTVRQRASNGAVKTLRTTLWSTRYGPVINAFQGLPLPWTTRTAFALADANAANFRFLNSFLATDQARSVAAELAVLRTYQGDPWINTLVTDSGGHAAFADIQAIPDVTDAEASRCDTALGKVTFASGGPPVLDGSRSACRWGTDRDSAVRGIFGPAQEPVLVRRDFAANSNDSYWMVNPGHPLTGFPRMIGDAGTGMTGTPGADLGLRTRSALAMVTGRINGTDGLGPTGFTFGQMKDLMYSDIQYGATLVKTQLVRMCRSFPGGRAPTGPGHTIAVGASCRVLAAWNGTEDPASRGAVLFRAFWENALPQDPWSHPFNAADPVHTPYGLDTASTSVQRAFGNALQELDAARLPYDVALGTVQFVTLNGAKIPLPGGPPDPLGEFNGIDQSGPPGSIPLFGSSYIQVVTWRTGDRCPQAATMLTYSESANPASPHYADQTKLFSDRDWVTPYFCPAQVAAHAVSTVTVRG